MTAAALLSRAEAAGLVLTAAAAGKLRMKAAAPPPTSLLHDLADAKPALLALLADREVEAAERAAIEAEPPLPDPGTPERDRLERDHAAMVAGLLQCAARRSPAARS